MPNPDEIQVLILLSLIPCVIAAMYSLTQVSEAIRYRGQARPQKSVREIHVAGRTLKRRV